MRVEMVNISDTKMSFVPDIFLEVGPPFSKGLDARPPPPLSYLTVWKRLCL